LSDLAHASSRAGVNWAKFPAIHMVGNNL